MVNRLPTFWALLQPKNTAFAYTCQQLSVPGPSLTRLIRLFQQFR